MFARRAELKPFLQRNGEHRTVRIFFIQILSGILATACTAVGGLASAATHFDGHWSVVIVTNRGECDPTSRYGLQIANGTIGAGAEAAVQGRVSATGVVRVTVRSGGQWAAGSGRLSEDRGSGVWQGKGSRGSCSGIWIAERRF